MNFELVIKIDGGERVHTEKYETGDEAAQAAVALRARDGTKWKVRKISGVNDKDWEAREAKRLADGTYKPLPKFWTDAAWWKAYGTAITSKHFAHVAEGKKGRIAFTESEESGRADRQAVISPGRYLERFFGEENRNHAVLRYALTKTDIKQIAERFGAMFDEIEVLFATTPEEVEKVYRAVGSCMQFANGNYPGSEHPARVYAGPDLAVAYLSDGKRITARSVVWPDRKVFVRCYGDESRLEAGLSKLGYKHGSREFTGARIRCIPDTKGKGKTASGKPVRYVFPYVDSGHGAKFTEDGGLVLCLGDDIELQSSQAGVAERLFKCAHCKTRQWHREAHAFEGVDWCSNCFQTYIVDCAFYGKRMRTKGRTNVLVAGKNQIWSREAAIEHAVIDDHTGGYVLKRETVDLIDGTIASSWYAMQQATLCALCHGLIPHGSRGACGKWKACQPNRDKVTAMLTAARSVSV